MPSLSRPRFGQAGPALATGSYDRIRQVRAPLPEGLRTDGPMGKTILTIMAAFAQLERDTMIEHTRTGLIAAAANSRKGGRPRKVARDSSSTSSLVGTPDGVARDLVEELHDAGVDASNLMARRQGGIARHDWAR